MNTCVLRCHIGRAVGRRHPVRAAGWFAAVTKLQTNQVLAGLVLAFALQLSAPARAQDAVAIAANLTQDQIIYGKHAPAACTSKLAKREVAARPNAASCLARRELRARRRLYQEQHRDESPALYHPGVE